MYMMMMMAMMKKAMMIMAMRRRRIMTMMMIGGRLLGFRILKSLKSNCSLPGVGFKSGSISNYQCLKIFCSQKSERVEFYTCCPLFCVLNLPKNIPLRGGERTQIVFDNFTILFFCRCS